MVTRRVIYFPWSRVVGTLEDQLAANRLVDVISDICMLGHPVTLPTSLPGRRIRPYIQPLNLNGTWFYAWEGLCRTLSPVYVDH